VIANWKQLVSARAAYQRLTELLQHLSGSYRRDALAETFG
jgi:ABC-type protease/lipase transport system fused ATPase/permease subunit